MKWLHIILSHSLFVSFCSVALCLQTYLYANIIPDPLILAFVFSSTLCSYNLYWVIHQLPDSGLLNIKSFAAIENHRFAIIIGSSVFGIICLMQRPQILMLSMVSVLLTIAYTAPGVLFRNNHGHKNTGYLKTMLLAFTWALVTVILPVHEWLFSTNTSWYFLLVHRFLFMLVICVLFDARDVRIDKIRNIKSIATVLKPHQLHRLTLVLMGCFFTLCFGMYWLHIISMAFLIGNLILLACIYVLYLKSLKKQGYLFYYFFVDGMMLFSYLLSYLASIS